MGDVSRDINEAYGHRIVLFPVYVIILLYKELHGIIPHPLLYLLNPSSTATTNYKHLGSVGSDKGHKP